MGQEEQNQKCCNCSSVRGGGCGGCGGGGSRFSRCCKKQKEKKDPQRGPGVAELERIRIEEQQKNDETIGGISPINNSYLQPNYHNFNQSSVSSSIPFLPPLPFAYALPTLNNSVQLPNPRGLPASVTGHGNVTNSSTSCAYRLENENYVVDPGLPFRSSLNFPYYPNPMWFPLHDVMQRMLQQPSLAVNVPLQTSSSSVQNVQMEPPSNQSYYSNHNSSRPEGEKMVGTKRPYPFSLGNPPSSSVYPNPRTNVHPHSRSGESASLGNNSLLDLELGNHFSRGGPSSSISISKSNSRESIKETDTRVLNGDFLSLAPPGTTSNSSDSKLKSPVSTSLTLETFERVDFALLPYQEPNSVPLQFEHKARRQRCSTKVHKGQGTSTKNDSNDEVEDDLDLNLKL